MKKLDNVIKALADYDSLDAQPLVHLTKRDCLNAMKWAAQQLEEVKKEVKDLEETLAITSGELQEYQAVIPAGTNLYSCTEGV